MSPVRRQDWMKQIAPYTRLRTSVRSRVRGRRAGITIIELLVAMSVMGVLMAILLPAVSSAREAARRMQCVNQFKQIGLALHAYHEVSGSLPQGWQLESSQESGFGWIVPLLPYMEQRAAYEKIDRNQPLADATNDQARRMSLAGLTCPSDMTQPTFQLYPEGPSPLLTSGSSLASTSAAASDPATLLELPTASYVGVFGTIEADDSFPAPPGDGAILCHRTVRFAELSRGLSNTLLVGERTMARVPSTWLGVDVLGEDAACRLLGSAMTSPNCRDCDECEFDSRHPGGSNFLLGDGSVRMISESINRDEYRRLARRSDE